jgi:hypothetical protein
MEAVMHTLSPEVLLIPEHLLDLFPPRAYGFGRSRESFQGQTGISFDYLAPPAAAANLTLGFLLHPERANRLILQKAQDKQQPGLDEVLENLIEKTIQNLPSTLGYKEEVMYTVGFIAIDHLIRLANEDGASPQAKARAGFHLAELKTWLEDEGNEGLDPIYRKAFIDQISKNKVKHLDHLPGLPPGSPIGMECMEFDLHPAVKFGSGTQQSPE